MEKYYITSKFVCHKMSCEILAAGDPSALNMIFATPDTIEQKVQTHVLANNENHDGHLNPHYTFCACAE